MANVLHLFISSIDTLVVTCDIQLRTLLLLEKKNSPADNMIENMQRDIKNKETSGFNRNTTSHYLNLLQAYFSKL